MSHAFTTHFTDLAFDLITDVTVSDAFDPAHPPNPMPTAIPKKGLWDTGATHTSISIAVATELGLISTGKQKIDHANGSDECDTYVVNMVLTNGITVAGIAVYASKLPAKCDVLIGMNLINQGDFALSQENGKTLFSFRIPSQHTVDFVKDINKSVLRSIRPNDPCLCGKSGKKFKMCCKYKYL